MVVLVIGPGGAGKSHVVRHARRRRSDATACFLDRDATRFAEQQSILQPGSNVHDLINKVKREDHGRFLHIAKATVEKCSREHPSKHVFVDVGATFQSTQGFAEWMAENTSVLIDAPADEAHPRTLRGRPNVPGFDRADFQGYLDREFSASRREIYGQATYRIDAAGLGEAALLEKFLNLLERILSVTDRNHIR